MTLGIFLAMATMMMMMVKMVVGRWSDGERRRVLHERAAGALDRIAEDLQLALGREPEGVTEVRTKLIGDLDAKTGQSQLFFVRSFELGPERALALGAGDGKPNSLIFRPFENNEAAGAGGRRGPAGVTDGDYFTGKKLGDFRALGGMAQVGYFAEDGVLYRSLRAPADGNLKDLVGEEYRTALMDDCLYLRFEYWSSRSSTWQVQPPKSKIHGPELLWDSTRGITAVPLVSFFLHKDKNTYNDPTDDVFPLMVRITLTSDSPMPRCLYTKLLEPLTADDQEVVVDSTQGFTAGGTEESYILVDKEWIHYREKKADRFVVDLRGARRPLDWGYNIGTDHPEGAVVRAGRTFHRVVFLPCYRQE